jgi:hypothetical protein
MVRFYLVPAESVVFGGQAARVPKYGPLSATPLVAGGTRWEARDYGVQPTFLVAFDNTAAEDTALDARADVTKFADVLDDPLGARLAEVQAGLEALNLPAQMVTAATTHRQVIRGVMGIILVAQCMQGKGRDIFAPGITLATTMAQIAAAPRGDLNSCMTTVGFATIAASATGATTVRQLLSAIAQTASPSPMLGVTV